MESANKINTMAASAVSEDEFKKVANKVSFITIVQNVLLSVFKLFAGIFAHSNAMISDAIHSAIRCVQHHNSDYRNEAIVEGSLTRSILTDMRRMECVAAIVLVHSPALSQALEDRLDRPLKT